MTDKFNLDLESKTLIVPEKSLPEELFVDTFENNQLKLSIDNNLVYLVARRKSRDSLKRSSLFDYLVLASHIQGDLSDFSSSKMPDTKIYLGANIFKSGSLKAHKGPVFYFNNRVFGCANDSGFVKEIFVPIENNKSQNPEVKAFYDEIKVNYDLLYHRSQM